MAASNSINQRIVLQGADEVRRHLDEIAAAGQRAGNTTRAALQAATGNLNTFTTGARNAGTSAGQMQFALQNLSFQVNDVATSLASGGDVMRVFAQQGGQVFQAFQQGGGLGNVLGAVGTSVSNMVTPMRLAAAGAIGLAAGFALIALRAESSESAARDFDVVLRAIGKTGQTTGKQLEDAAHKFRDVGLTTMEARALERQALLAGIQPQDIARIVRTGAELNKIFGEGSAEKFIASAKEGGPVLDDYAKRLNIVTSSAADVTRQFEASDAAVKQLNRTIDDEVRARNRSIVENQRQTNQQIKDLTRVHGTQRQEIELASSRAIEEIKRQSEQKISDDFRVFAQKQADDSAKALADRNAKIQEEAQKFGDAQAKAAEIGQRVAGSFQDASSAGARALVALGTAWDDLMTALAKSTAIQAIIKDVGDFIGSIKTAVEWLDKLGQAINNIPGVGQLTVPPAFRSDVPLSQRIFSAQGGLIRGPGTATSDSIPAQLSNGEFVVNAVATRLNLPVLQAINSFMPAMPRPRMPRGFAAGGLVSTGGGSAVHIHLGGGTFPLSGDQGVVNSLARVARKSALLSAGRKPSTA